MKAVNPVIPADFPDPDLIRVGGTYYMASTTMHFFPGAAILASRDLVDWGLVGHAVLEPEGTPARRLEKGASAYGQGMWAPCLRRHEDVFYLCHVANDTRKTYLLRADDPSGPWKKGTIEGFYHDPSLLFDEDGRVFIVYGNSTIYMTELDGELRGPKPGGLHRAIIQDRPGRRLGYEGAHVYKIGGRYYVFLIHWLADGSGRRTQACFRADSPEGEFIGRDILDDDMGFFNMGVAQGGIVDTPDGDWYAMLFQDRGAAGRMPILLPLSWEDGFPVLGKEGKVPAEFELRGPPAKCGFAPIVSSDDFRYQPGADGKISLQPAWEWNHEPRPGLWAVDGRRGELILSSGSISENVSRAPNTLTQRALWPACSASVRVDGAGLREGDCAGICALQGRYGLVGLERRGGHLCIVMRTNPGEAIMEMGRTMDLGPGVEEARLPSQDSSAELMVKLDFRDMHDQARFFFKRGEEWTPIGPVHKLSFGLDHFTGCRFGLFLYSTQEIGGWARFSEFRYGA